MKSLIELRRAAQTAMEGLRSGKPCIFVDPGSDGVAAGGASLAERFESEAKSRGIAVRIAAAGALGWREVEPLVAIDIPGNPRIVYANATADQVPALVATVAEGGSPRLDLALAADAPRGFAGLPDRASLPFFAPQRRVALRNVGDVDPEDLNDALLHDAYAGLAKALTMAPGAVIEQIGRTGLRARGTDVAVAQKWLSCRRGAAGERFLIADAAYGYEQRGPYDLLLEGDPHSVLEGILIAAYAAGANRAYLCIDPESTVALRRAQRALDQMRAVGLGGDDIFGPGFGCAIEIRAVPRRLAAGEDSILIAALEGRQPRARINPLDPESEGLFARPTVVQDIESLALAAAILAGKAGLSPEFEETRIVELSGALTRTGIVEVPVGTTLRTIIDEIGGGPLGKALKAVQIGGPAGGWIPAAHLDVALAPDEIRKAGCAPGSASIFAVSEDSCAVDLARQAAVAAHRAVCGKCTFGREGTRQIMDILTDLTRGQGAPSDLGLLLDISDGMKAGSLCANGRNAPDALLTALEHFRSEFDAHAEGKPCPAHVCAGSTAVAARGSR